LVDYLNSLVPEFTDNGSNLTLQP